MLLNRQNILGLICLLAGLVSPLSHHVANRAGATFASFRHDGIKYLLISLVSLLTLLKHPGCLSLFDDCNFEAIVDKDGQVFVEGFFWEANVQLFSSTHPVQIK